MQRKLYTEFHLLFDFISATGQGNMHGPHISVFRRKGGGGGFTTSTLVHLEYISYPFGCNVVNVVNIYKLADQMYLCIKTQECT